MKFRIFLFFLMIVCSIQGQQKRLTTQFSPFLEKTYYSFSFGAVYYPYTDANLKPGYVSESVKKNMFSGRFLLGYRLREDLGIQFGVMRPASWFQFENINNIGYDRSVWLNLWSLSLQKDFKLSDKLSLNAELGIGNLARVGFPIDYKIVYENAQYATLVTGLGLSYKLNEKWRFLLSTLYLPASKRHNQPYTFQTTLGLQYRVKQVPRKLAEDYAADKHYFFPKSFIQIGYSNSQFGFLANEFFSMNLAVGDSKGLGIPIFWLGVSQAAQTISITYQQTAYRSRKLFSLDWGVSITGFQTVATQTNVFAFSIFPVIRFYVYRPKNFDMYLNYSIIGPTYLTKKNIDNLPTGPKLTYQDFMGIGAFFGKHRKYNFELKIMHYSNGNISPQNDGVAIPVMLTFGKTL